MNLMSWIIFVNLCRLVLTVTVWREEKIHVVALRKPRVQGSLDHGHGRFFRFRQNSAQSASLPNSHSVQHHWLCDSCAKTYTLDYREAMGVLLSLRLRTPDDGYIPLLIAAA